MKRLLLLVAVAALGGGAFTAGPATAIDLSGSFIDDDGNQHEPNINALAAAGITQGCGFRLFCPRQAVTRAEMATFLVRALGLTAGASGPFTDVASNIHEGNINALAAAGITLGCSTGRYCPNAFVRRDEMASLLVRAFQLAPATSGSFADTGGNAHTDDINALATAGITLGCSLNLFCPTDAVSRDQMASFLVRALDLTPIHPAIPLGPGLAVFCTKDGQLCSGSATLPRRSIYRIREGIFQVQPASPQETAEFNSSTTRVELLINGQPVVMNSFDPETAGNRSNRWFEGEFTLAPGTHIISARWIWNGALTQTTNLTVTVP